MEFMGLMPALVILLLIQIRGRDEGDIPDDAVAHTGGRRPCRATDKLDQAVDILTLDKGEGGRVTSRP